MFDSGSDRYRSPEREQCEEFFDFRIADGNAPGRPIALGPSAVNKDIAAQFRPLRGLCAATDRFGNLLALAAGDESSR
jgi:hypothetical protein